jgi:hypothetical protein
LADISQLAVGSIPNLPRPRVFDKRVGLNPNIFQNSEDRAIARCNRKTRQMDFREAEVKLGPCRRVRPRAQRNPRLPGLLMAALGAIAFAPALAIFARHAD